MALKRMDNVGIVVDDLEAAIAFFSELGLVLDGQTSVAGEWVDRMIGLEGVRADIAMMRTPDGNGRLELSKFLAPAAQRLKPPTANTVGLHRVMFTVDDLKDVLERLGKHGGKIIGGISQFQDLYLLCNVRGPEGIIIALAQELH